MTAAVFPWPHTNPETQEPKLVCGPPRPDCQGEAVVHTRTGCRSLQSGRQARCWREASGWTFRGRREPRRAVAVGIWGAGLLASADRREWTTCPIPSRSSYRASFVLRRRPAARLGIGGTSRGTFDCGLHRQHVGNGRGTGWWWVGRTVPGQSGVLSQLHARPSISCLGVQ